MTPQQIEALKLALEALEGFYEYGYDRQECFEHITAIKEALLEHAMQEVQRLGQEIEQEPVAWQWLGSAHFRKKLPKNADVTAWNPLYTAPPQRKPLTDEQIWDAYMKAPVDIDCHVSDLHKFARAIEAAHGIKE